MADNINNLRINGINPLSYMGVNPYTPVPFFVKNRAPTTTDSQNFTIGTIWLYVNNLVTPNTYEIWMLVSLNGGIATWIQFDSSPGDVQTLTGNTGGAVGPDGAANINVVGDAVGITIAGNPGTHTLTASLVGGGIAAQSFPTDSGTATPNSLGVLNVKTQNATQGCGASVLFSAPGSSNTIQLDVTDAQNNTTIGKSAGGITLANTLNNIALGVNALSSVTTGADSNTALGFNSLGSLVSGNFNVAVGSSAGSNYVTNETNNILLGNQGVVADSNTIRIGDSQTKAYMAGINGNTVGSPTFVTIDTGTNQLGVAVGTVVTTGVYTPSITVGGSSTGIVYTPGNNFGNWISWQSGAINIVLVSASLAVTSIGILTGDIVLTNLPFTIAGPPPVGSNFNINFVTGVNLAGTPNAIQLIATASPPTTSASLFVGYNDGTSHTAWNNTQIILPFQIGITILYKY